MFKEISACRICGNQKLVPVLDLGDMYLTGVFPKDPEAPLTHGPMSLVKCDNEGDDDACGLLQLRQTYDLDEMYGDNYGYRSSLNRSMVEHLRGISAQLKGMAELSADDIVLDIGSNDGTLLSFFEGATRIGIDPTANKFRKYYQPGITVVPDFFSAARFREVFGDRKAKIVTSIAMFYDLERPIDFVREVAGILADDGLWHLEFSYAPLMVKDTIYDTVCQEHLEYYGLHQLQWMAERCGLHIRRATTTDANGGSLAVTLGKQPGPDAAEVAAFLRREHEENYLGLVELQAFARRVAAHRDALKAKLAELKASGARVVGYGASTKGNVLLQYCGFTPDDLPCIAEVNEDKLGSYTPGSRIPIVSEAEARASKPDYMLVFPWHFKAGLVRREEPYLRSGGKLLFPMPEVEVVTAQDLPAAVAD